MEWTERPKTGDWRQVCEVVASLGTGDPRDWRGEAVLSPPSLLSPPLLASPIHARPCFDDGELGQGRAWKQRDMARGLDDGRHGPKCPSWPRRAGRFVMGRHLHGLGLVLGSVAHEDPQQQQL